MTITQSSTRLVAVAAGVAVALALLLGASMPVRAAALSQTQVQSILNLLTSFGADSATLANVSAALNGTAMTRSATNGSMMAGGVCPFTWSRSLTTGSKGTDVMTLQKFLNMDSGTMVAASGAGSAGMETSTFGPATKKAVMKFQVKYGISKVGNVGPMTRGKLNSLCTVAMTPTPTTPGTPSPTPTPGVPGVPVATGTATITVGAQPANAIAPSGASRVPFTAFTVTANGSAITLNSVSVMRQGPSLDTDFAGVVLVDAATGVQYGTSRVLDSNHSATVGTPVTIPAGTSKTFWVAGNIAAATVAGSGDVASFAVTAINTNSAVSGALPIVGASNTINTALIIGSATIQISSFDPSSPSTQPVGTTGYRFTGFRLQAGSAEDTSFKSVTWYQSGSASNVQNLVTIVNGTSYPTVADSTGRYFSAVFPTGITIAKGASVDVYLQGDLAGNSTANTFAEFDINRNTDIYVVGNTYGFGITPTLASTGSYTSGSNHGTVFIGGNSTPFIQGSTLGITAGTFSTIQNASSVGAQNIAVNVANQTLGGFTTSLTGEAIQTQSLTVHILSSAAIAPLTNVSLVNETGSVVAGPFNAKCAVSAADTTGGATTLGTTCAPGTGLNQIVTFSGAINFTVGAHTYTLKGQVPSGVANGVTIQANTNPTSDWTGVTGNTTGNTITTGVTNFTMNTMTVKAASLTIGNANTPTSQPVVAGGSNITFAGIQLDATQSGEDVRLSSIPLTLTATASAAPNLSACQLTNTSVTPNVALNTGSRVINSTNFTAAASQSVTFSFDNSLTIPKGTTVTLMLNCNLSSAAVATNTFVFTAGSPSVSGVTSGNAVTPILASGNGPTMTVFSGASIAVSNDSTAPSYVVVAGGSTGVTANVIKFRATNESLNLQKVGLVLASGSSADVTQVTLFAGSNIQTSGGVAVAPGTILGTASFTGSATTSTSTLSTSYVLPRDLDATIVVKTDLAAVGSNQSGTAGDLVQVNYAALEGTGVNSGSKIFNSTSLASPGFRVYRSYPIFALETGTSALPSNAPADGRLMRFKVTANNSGTGIGVNQFKFTVAPSGSAVVTASSIFLTAYTDAAYSIVANGYSGGPVNTTGQSSGTVIITPTTPIEIGAGTTYYFELKGTVTGTIAGSSVTTNLLGDSPAVVLGTSAAVATTSNIVWSGNTLGTSAVGATDWANGFSLVGLPSNGLNQTRSQ